MPEALPIGEDAGEKKKAQPFFDRGRTLAEIGSFDAAIDVFIQGLAFDPENIEAHKALREAALRRKAAGGKDLGFLEKRKLPRAKDNKRAMLNAEKLLAYDPGNVQHMESMTRAAGEGGLTEVSKWIGAILRQAGDRP